MQETMELYKYRCKQLINRGLALEELNNYENFKEIFDLKTFKNILREKQNRKNKRYRTKQKYMEMLKIKSCMKEKTSIVFGTCTLSDKYLSKKEETRVKLIDVWLKKHFVYSILNKDFGSKTEREHYHFIGITTEELIDSGKKSKKGSKIYNLEINDYKIGFNPDILIVDFEKYDSDSLINYLLKLNNHSNKLSTSNRIRVIKNNKADMIILINNIDSKKQLEKVKKSKLKNSNFATYDTLNKISVSNLEIPEELFDQFLDGNITYNDLISKTNSAQL